jgi:hypothetical protein
VIVHDGAGCTSPTCSSPGFDGDEEAAPSSSSCSSSSRVILVGLRAGADVAQLFARDFTDRTSWDGTCRWCGSSRRTPLFVVHAVAVFRRVGGRSPVAERNIDLSRGPAEFAFRASFCGRPLVPRSGRPPRTASSPAAARACRDSARGRLLLT